MRIINRSCKTPVFYCSKLLMRSRPPDLHMRPARLLQITGASSLEAMTQFLFVLCRRLPVRETIYANALASRQAGQARPQCLPLCLCTPGEDAPPAIDQHGGARVLQFSNSSIQTANCTHSAPSISSSSKESPPKSQPLSTFADSLLSTPNNALFIAMKEPANITTEQR